MSTQSSAAVACRALVMLACLIAIPLAALFGTALPDTVKQLLQRYLGVSVASAAVSLSEAPRFVPGARTGSTPAGSTEAMQPGTNTFSFSTVPTAVPGEAAAPTTAAWSADPSPAAAQMAAVRADSPGSAVIPARYDAPNPGNLVPVARSEDRQVPLPLGGNAATAATSGSSCPAASATLPARSAAADQFMHVQDRLRQLGATYYLLESWGCQGQLYRFYCKMAIGGNANYTRYFEATDLDPLRAMANVLQQVEAWRAARP